MTLRKVLVATCLVLAAACGDATAGPVSLASVPPLTAGADLPATVVDETGAVVTVDSVERIIPLDGDLAEIVFALGLGDRVVATDLSATYPPAADALPEVGYQRALNAETVAAFDPTVLLATDVAGPPAALDALRRLGYPLVIVPSRATPDGPAEKIRAVAAALGHPDRGEALAADVDEQIAEATVGWSPDGPRVLALYVRGGAAQLVLGRGYASHWVIEAAGGVDAALSIGVEESAPISAEAVLEADPDVIVVTTTGLESVGGVDGLLELGALGETAAGRARRVLAFDDQLLLGNGPRVASVVRELHEQLTRIQEDR